MIDELYIDGQKCDISDTGIALEYKSNIFGELDKFESSYSFTIKLPKTDRNVRIIEAADIVSNAGRFPFIKHGGRVLRDGVVIADNATVYITGTTPEAINVALTFNGSKAAALLAELKERADTLRDLQFPRPAIPWGTADAVNGAPEFYPAANFGLGAADRGLTPPVIYMGESSRFTADKNVLRALFNGALLGALKIPAQDITQLYDLTRDWVIPLLTRNESPAMSNTSEINFTNKSYPDQEYGDVVFNSVLPRDRSGVTHNTEFLVGIVNEQYGYICNAQVYVYGFGSNSSFMFTQDLFSYYADAVQSPFLQNAYGFTIPKGRGPSKMVFNGNLYVGVYLKNLDENRALTLDEYPQNITLGIMKCRIIYDEHSTMKFPYPTKGTTRGIGKKWEQVGTIKSVTRESSTGTSENYITYGFELEDAEVEGLSGDELEIDNTREQVIYALYFGYGDGTPMIIGYTNGSYKTGGIGVADILVRKTDGFSLRFAADGNIGPDTYAVAMPNNTFYAEPNAPKIKQFDFFKALLDMTGLIAMTSNHDASGYGLRLLTLRQIIGNAEDWTARLVDATPEQEFKVSDFARLNWFKFKDAAEADGNVPTNDAALTMDAPSATEEKTAIELPFAASRNVGGVAFAKVYTYEASNEDGKIVETAEFEAREESVPIWEVTNTNTARASLTWRRLLDDNYKEFAAILKEPRTIKAKVRMTAVDLSGLRYDTAKYFRQFGARFLLISLRTQSGSDICTAELVKVPASII